MKLLNTADTDHIGTGTFDIGTHAVQEVATSTTCGSRAEFSMIVYPSAIDAAIMMLIVAPTETISK